MRGTPIVKLAKNHLFATVVLGALVVPVEAQQNQFPTKPLRMLVGFAAGGPTDIVARAISQKMSDSLGQPIVVENRAGAGGMVATEYVAKSPADGYTLLMGTIGGVAVAMSLNPNRGYDTLRDLAPVSHTVNVTNVLVVNPSVKANNVAELLELARAQPGKLNYGSSGVGTITNLSGELLKSMANVQITTVLYKGGAPATTAILRGEVELTYENALILLPHLKSGKLRALGVTSPQRSPLMPDVPAIAETIPGYAAVGWYGLLVPAKTPTEVIARLHSESVKAVRAPDVIERLASNGADAVGSTPAEFGAFIRTEIDKWAKVVKSAGMKAE